MRVLQWRQLRSLWPVIFPCIVLGKRCKKEARVASFLSLEIFRSLDSDLSGAINFPFPSTNESYFFGVARKRVTLVPHLGQMPCTICLPFGVCLTTPFLMSCFVRHLTQKPSKSIRFSFPWVNRMRCIYYVIESRIAHGAARICQGLSLWLQARNGPRLPVRLWRRIV